MQKIEKKIINFIEKNIGWICIGAVTVIRLMICFYVRRYESGDFNAVVLCQDLAQNKMRSSAS